MPDNSVASSIAAYRHRLDHLGAEGRELRAALTSSPDGSAALDALRVWQRECAATVSQLSGGSKAHWLSRAFSEALLVPAAAAGAASIVTIVDRLLGVLDSARASLADAAVLPASDPSAPPPPRPRFTFVNDPVLRSQLEGAYLDGQRAAGRGQFVLALLTFSSILETIITDALERRGLELAPHDPPAAPIVEWPFATRIAIAERVGIISRGCARLPGVAREYRALLDAHGETAEDTFVTARDAKLASDVLHVILRDLAPGR